MTTTKSSTIPPALLPDGTLALLHHLRLPGRLRLRILRELDIRRGSDRSGPRLPVDAAEWLRAHEDAA